MICCHSKGATKNGCTSSSGTVLWLVGGEGTDTSLKKNGNSWNSEAKSDHPTLWAEVM